MKYAALQCSICIERDAYCVSADTQADGKTQTSTQVDSRMCGVEQVSAAGLP